MFDGFKKRDGIVVNFDTAKITTAINKALDEVYGPQSKGVPDYVLSDVQTRLLDLNYKIPTLEQVQMSVIESLEGFGWSDVATKYKQYKENRDRARQRIYVQNKKAGVNITDDSLLLVNDSGYVTSPWDRQRIIHALQKNTSLDDNEIILIAKTTENRIINSKISIVTTSFIREMVNNVLLERGHTEHIQDLSVYRVSSDFIKGLMEQKSVENSNVISNNPEAVSLNISGLVLKEWALDNVFSKDVSAAHRSAALHIHDLEFPTRLYCGAHSVVYIAKYGLVGLNNLSTESSPAKSASVLTGHLNTFLASMQSNYAGALGLGYLNIFYAPYVHEMDETKMFQVAQELIFNGSQNAFSRGGQTLFLDFNIHSNVPDFLKDVPAIGPGGCYYVRDAVGVSHKLIENWPKDKEGVVRELIYRDPHTNEDIIVHAECQQTEGEFFYDKEIKYRAQEIYGFEVLTYSFYEKSAKQFAVALLKVWEQGDKNGRIFPFPKCDFHVDRKTFESTSSRKIFDYAAEVASRNGSVYFVFDRDSVTLSACCRLRSTLDDKSMLFFPEKLSFCGFQNITINIPQAHIRTMRKFTGSTEYSGTSSADWEDRWGVFISEIDEMMSLAVKAHLDKKTFVDTIMHKPGQPLYQVGMIAPHGKPYVELDKATYIIGLIGVDNAIAGFTGKHMHEDEESRLLGMKLLTHMYLKSNSLGQRHGLKISLEESPAESAARRLALTDLRLFPKETSNIVRGKDTGAEYYTNSIHFLADANVSLVTRIRQQSKFHPLIQSGAIVHAFVGEEEPSAESISKLVIRTFEETQCAQLTISPEFTFCNVCGEHERGLKDKCWNCGSEDIDGITRVVGYFSIVKNWNKSKREGELVSRHRGTYSV